MLNNLGIWRDIASSRTLCTDQADSKFSGFMLGLRVWLDSLYPKKASKNKQYLESSNTYDLVRIQILVIKFTHRLTRFILSLISITINIKETYE
ncbi:MAG: hypothetical protein CMB64_01595 [Euryarchaeota archaeon]|nr:hypothetical protein [Euryarchaeota archaeon]